MSNNNEKKSSRKFWIVGSILLILLVIAVMVVINRRNFRKNQQESQQKQVSSAVSDRTFKVQRDDLPIGLIQGGTVNASKKHKLSLRANFGTKLLWIIEENSWVKAGDVLIKFETDDLKKRIEDYEIDLDNLTKELAIAIEEEKILASTNAADIQAAVDRLQQAQDALKKYRRIERVNSRNSHEEKIKDAENALKDAQDAYEEVRDSRDNSNSSNSDEDPEEVYREKLQTKLDTVESKEIALTTAESNRRAWRRYDHPNRLMVLNNALENAELNLRKVKISVNAKLVQKKRQIDNYRKRIKMTETQLERHRSYMEMMVIKAPVDGVVIYSDPDQTWGRTEVQVGMDVGKGRVLITIPEMSNLIVDFDLPEAYRSKIKVGDEAIISPDSLPGVKVTGKISNIATLPVNLINWDSSSPKVYKAKIQFDEQSPLLVNGMSVQLNVVTKVIPKTLFVPVEAIFEDNDRFFVYQSTLGGVEEVDVKIGESNDNFVQILSGLKEGDVVYLYRPYQNKQGDK
ncbi:MAG: efflux RND transporter periplasmic adaptor subunit [Lentisphaeria bacterium]|nr:efflux RND transporter periplasmic adaptor subunit [Lentisphaeria bacterium]